MTGGGEYSDFVASFFPEQQCCCGHPMIFSAAVAPFVLLGSIIINISGGGAYSPPLFVSCWNKKDCKAKIKNHVAWAV